MKILITGGNGFIAGHLKNFLSSKHTVYAPGKEQLNCLEPQEVNAFFDTHEIDIVIHTALAGREQLFDYDLKLTNEGMAMWYNIYNNRHRYKKLIQYGSAYELNLSTVNELTKLDNVLNALPISGYGSNKNRIARMCNETENFYTLRLFGHFHHTEAAHRFFKKLVTSDQFTIASDKKFDYFNLEDTLKVTEFVINESPIERDINLVYSEKLLISKQVELFCDINNINPIINIKEIGYELTGSDEILKSFNIQLQGLLYGFSKF